jgi:hypothetical protein
LTKFLNFLTGAQGTGSGLKLYSIMRDRRKACATKDNEYFKAHEERERKKLAETNKRQEEECVEFMKIRENNEKMRENNLKL